MAETFYGVLGVADDAETETIRRAYREQVKEHHPDVSDDPGAPEQFKRLTAARDVLVDPDERTRYDGLGHAEYVDKHVESAVWDPTENGHSTAGTATNGTEATVATAASESAAETNDDGYDRTAWLGEDGPGKQRRRHRQRQQPSHAAGATAAARDWQHASKAYQRADTGVGTGQQSPLKSLLSALRAVGPWLVVHAIFVGSAIATSWLAFSGLAGHVGVSWPTLVLSILLIGMAVFASVFHLISRLYS